MSSECQCEDADRYYCYVHELEMCHVRHDDGYICTRPKGHEGMHHAHGTTAGECFRCWEKIMIKNYELLQSELLKMKTQLLDMLDCSVGETATELKQRIHKCDDAEELVSLSTNALYYLSGRYGICKSEQHDQ